MFEWVLNMPRKLVEYNLKIYLIHALTDFDFMKISDLYT